MTDAGEAARRICVVGDEFVAGVGDPKGLGWTGRVAARTPGRSAFFALGVPGEATPGLLARWQSETGRRFADDTDNRLVVGLGRGDLDEGVSLARSRLNLANVVDDAVARGIGVLVVGPAPAADAATHGRVGELADAFADVCERRKVPFVDCFGPLEQHEQWYADFAAGDGVHPGQAGYGLLAWLVLHGGWYSWLGLPQP